MHRIFSAMSTSLAAVASCLLLSSRSLAAQESVQAGTVAPTSSEASPVPVTVITAEDIERQYVGRIDQLIRQLVPTAVAPDFGPTSEQTGLVLRGATSFQWTGGMVKVYLDGIEIANRSFATMDPASIERIEIIRGPQAATIYGGDAAGGVMLVSSKRGAGEARGLRLGLRAATGLVESPYDGSGALRQQYDGTVSGAARGISYHVGGGYGKVGDWMPGYSLSAPSVFAGMRAARGKLALDLTARYDGQRTGLPGTASPGTIRLRADRHAEESSLGATVTYAATPWWHHRFTAGIDRLNLEIGRRDSLADGSATSMTGNDGVNRKTTLAYQTWINLPLSSSTSTIVTAGVDRARFRDERTTRAASMYVTTAPAASVVDSSSTFSEGESSNTGYFLQAQLHVRHALFLTAGARADRFTYGQSLGQNDIGTPITSRVGIAYVQPLHGAELKLRGAYGSALQVSPAVSGTYGALAPQIFGENDAFIAGRQVGGEVGADLTFGSRGSVHATYYHQNVRDVVDRVVAASSGSTPIYRYLNLGNIRNAGLELEGDIHWGAATLRAQYAAMVSRVTELDPDYVGDLQVGDIVHRMPRHTAGLTLTVVPFKTTNVAAGMAYIGERKSVDFAPYFSCSVTCGVVTSNNLRRYPAYAKINLAVTQQLTPQFAAFVVADNLTDVEVAEVTATVPTRGRVVTVGASFRY